jgi:hypothetical protein
MTTPSSTRLPRWLWLWFPLAVVPAQFVAKAIGEDFYRALMRGERGLIENLTVLALVVAIVLALTLFARRRSVASRLFGPFCLVMAAGCFFFAGEEASWGQHWIGYETPEQIAERNDQGEFNLHNDPLLERILDQPPRLALTLAALVGGVIAPLLRRRRGNARPRFDGQGIGGWIWPTIECLPASVLVLTVSLPKKVFEATMDETPPFVNISPGETKELCLGLFLMFYLLVMRLELAAAKRD